MLSDMGMRTMLGSSEGSYGEDLEELGLLLQRRQEASERERERELNIYRSGSAPPTVEGSLSAVGGLFGHGGDLSEEDLRSDPAYSSYYYAHVNLNPRLPPPALSKEDSRFTQRLQAGGSGLGGIGDRRRANRVDDEGSRSLFSMQPGLASAKEGSGVEQSEASSEWLERGDDGLIGLSGLGLGGRQKSLAHIFQDDLGRATPISGHPSRPASRNAFDNGAETKNANVQSMIGVQSVGQSASHTYASALGGSLSRSTTPDPQLVARAPSPRLPPVGGRYGATDKKIINGPSSFNSTTSLAESVDLVTALSGMSLSANGVGNEVNHLKSVQQEIVDHSNFLLDLQSDQNHLKQHLYLKNSKPAHFHLPSVSQSTKPSHPDLSKNGGSFRDQPNSSVMVDEQAELHRSTVSSPNSYFKAPASPIINSGGSPHYRNIDNTNSALMNYGLGGYSINPASPSMMPGHLGSGNLPPLFENAANVPASAIAAPGIDTRALGGFPLGPNLTGVADMQNLKLGNHAAASSLQVPLMDPLYAQYLRTAEYTAQVAAGFNDPSLDRNYIGNSYMDLVGLQKAYLGAMLSPQKSQYGLPFLGKSGGPNHGYYGNPTFGLGMSYPGSPLTSAVLPGSPVGPGSPIRHNERNMRYPSGMRNIGGGAMGWHLDGVGGMDESFASSLLEEFKSNKTRCFELSEIASHVVEFSADQYGSRFIQQKLETATTDEKNMVFEEIFPQALSLMTDVFGNYVIQKFFEHGTPTQRRELANQLTGHVLTLSLQMYGCRVIQKAIEVVDLDQQTKMVAELDGHIMRCVRDQNGNHVIQKCIECIPQDAIEFIISSFYDQVVTLSTHPYGCRVIQRVLEHCNDLTTQRIMMDEILQNVCMLAQDQYGNYVVQHVLEHGKPHERSSIIKKLAGQIVQMSQQKFASNVVEKCLSFGGPAERQLLVNEMLGSTDENEPLQAMMKDQFANYVVQKVLETCDDQQRELILSRIKVHLNALKKYTYGKHIVARVEKLVAAGERRIGLQSSYPSQMV
ncbi:hypothetical protein MRB53_010961 [Persea americana]|uniref:Uncharacterized protein n=1 Tax=Persea americana TaxID=3435 RepID=A0ACC2LTN5_PERAE|nr:hypothetical protein MRB53_010961 [Persea americana]